MRWRWIYELLRSMGRTNPPPPVIDTEEMWRRICEKLDEHRPLTPREKREALLLACSRTQRAWTS